MSNINISREANLTSNGTHEHWNCRPVIIPELHMVFNSRLDVVEKLGVARQTVIDTLKGRRNTCPIWENDENGNRRKVGYCHLYEASDYESAMEMIMECGRKDSEELSKANARLDELERKAALWDAYQAEQEAARKAEEELQAAIAKAKVKRERREHIRNNAYQKYLMAEERLAEAERELAELQNK